jgi:hypothetical protein
LQPTQQTQRTINRSNRSGHRSLNLFAVVRNFELNEKVGLLIIASALQVWHGCSRVSESPHETQSLRAAAEKTAPTEHQRVLPPCPSAPYPMLKVSAPDTGHHKVFLSWNASSSSGLPGDPTVGYCLYRSQTPGMAKNCPQYSKCEQVNHVPVRSTLCVDDLVKDRTRYYNVAIAINSVGKTSTASEEAIATIPAAGQQNPAPPDAGSYPACRAPAASSQEVH